MPDEFNPETAFTSAQPAAEPSAPAPQPSFQDSPLFSQAKEAGLPLDGISSDADLAKAVLDAYIQNRPYADYGRSGAAQPQPEPARQPEPAEPEFNEDKYFSEAWNLPQLSPGAQWAIKAGAFEEDDRGMLVPVKGLEQAALPYVKEVNDYQRSRTSLNETFASNPVKFMAEKLMPYFKHHFSNHFQELSQQSVQGFEQQALINDFRKENASWLYTPDGRAFTEHGQRFSGIVDHWMSKGLSLQDALEVAKSMAPPPKAEPPVDAQTPALPGEQRQRDEHGRFLPAGTPAPAAPQPSPQESFIEKARKNATANASRGGGSPPVRQGVDNEGDLENLFVVAGKKAFAAA